MVFIVKEEHRMKKTKNLGKAELLNKIKNKSAILGVVGLSYIDLLLVLY